MNRVEKKKTGNLQKHFNGTSILTDPVLGEMDGAAGFNANILDADAFKRVSPPVESPSQLYFV
jgi:hypothetical protein